MWEIVEFAAVNHAGLTRRDIRGIDRIETTVAPRFDVGASMRRVMADHPVKVVSVGATMAGVVAGVTSSMWTGYAAVGIAAGVAGVAWLAIRRYAPDAWFERPGPVKHVTHVHEPGMSQDDLMRWLEYARLSDEIRAENLEDDGFEFVG